MEEKGRKKLFSKRRGDSSLRGKAHPYNHGRREEGLKIRFQEKKSARGKNSGNAGKKERLVRKEYDRNKKGSWRLKWRGKGGRGKGGHYEKN